MTVRCSYMIPIVKNGKVTNHKQCKKNSMSIESIYCSFHQDLDDKYTSSESDVSVCLSCERLSFSDSEEEAPDMFSVVNEIETQPVDSKLEDDSVRVLDPAIIVTPPNIFDNVTEIGTSPIKGIQQSDTATTIPLNNKELDDQEYFEKKHHTIIEDEYFPFVPKCLQLGEFSFNLDTPCNITFFSGPLLESFVVTRFQVIMIKGKGTDSCFFTMIPIVKDQIFGETVISREPPFITCQKASKSVIAKFESGLDEVVDFTDLLIYDDSKIIDLYAKSVGCNFIYNGKFYNYKPKNIMILSPISNFRDISF